ncbi:ATP-binding protein [Psychromonas ossibalaenae]|uniref:ATP-binding protein n=1 Tax=Psychromonas ossibalaenae TaxID=444922 RepID=UPI0003745178|nr:ATP-binding protein [Psychromonas ossibalaenae]
MRLTIFHKLFVSLLLISAIMMAGMALLINNSFQSGLQTYLNQREVEKLEVIAVQISQYYSTQYGWNKIKAKPQLWNNLLKHIAERPKRDKHSSRDKRARGHRSAEEVSLLHNRVFLLDEQENPVLYGPKQHKHQKVELQFIKVPILVNDKTVGWISIIQKNQISGPLAESFFEQQLNNFYLIAAWAALFSFVVAALLVRHFLKPLKDLHRSAEALENGDFQQQIPVHGNDELAELSVTFNSLTNTLKEQKQTREQWLADISHELRTPIAVLLSEIEAIQDGIRKAEPKYIKSLHDQVMNLRCLVDDLYQLSLSDAGVNIDRSQQVNLTQLLQRVADQNEARLAEKNIQLKRNYENSRVLILKADQKSLIQLILNIFENSYRYTDPGGQMQITLLHNEQSIDLIIEDSAPAVPNDSLEKLFNRLYRVDKSRSRASGGSGLGLSICRNIVNAHGGSICAEHSSLGGLQIKISLPIKEI